MENEATAQGFSRLGSRIDASVNFFRSHPDGGMEEARFVQRVPERFIVYVSSMTGCDKACRFCHLTQTGQTMSTLLPREAILGQAVTVLNSVTALSARTVHFNFMARGEPMSNPAVDARLFASLSAAADELGLASRIKLSSIYPLDFRARDPAVLTRGCPSPVDFYYSLYSLDPDWRRRWIPKADAPEKAFAWLARFQGETGNRVILHWALIEGENDGDGHAEAAAEMARRHGLRFDFNLVRYNPANGKSREAAPERIESFVRRMRANIGDLGRVKVIPRVGMDVAASCGMFLSEANERQSRSEPLECNNRQD